MINNLIFSSNSLGQKLKGVGKNYFYLKNILDKNKYNIYDIKCTNNLFNNLDILYKVNQKTYGKRINIGGDHSISISTVAYSLNKYKNLKVIWIDAHPDINTYERSLSKNYHGMPLSFLTGIDNDKKFTFLKNKLDLSNLLYIGIRDIDEFEQKIIDDNNINVITVNEIRNNFGNSIDKINNFVKNDPIHLSFDVDSLDPSIFQCTGTKVNNGLMLDESIDILKNIRNKQLINTDIVELNLEIGNLNHQINSIHNFSKILETLN